MNEDKKISAKKNDNQNSLSNDKIKLILSIIAVIFAALWSVLWYLFPMQWYALFFNSTLGSNVLLILLASVISLPMIFIFSKITKIELPILKSLIINIISLVAIDFIYSIFHFERFYLVIISVLVFCGINIWIFGKSAYKDKNIKLSPIKKQPIITIIWAAVYSVILVVGDILLFRLMLSAFIAYY